MDTPVNIFAPTKPHAGQLEVMNDPSRFKILRAGRKWRKTSLGVSMQMENAALCTRKLTYPFILPFQTQARESVWNDHVQRFMDECSRKKYPIKVNEQSMSITHPNGARFKLVGAENVAALRSISNWGYVIGDEYDDWRSGIWEEIIRPNLMPNKAGALIMGTPKGKRHMWKIETENPDFKAFHYTSFDNPDLDREELESMVNEYKLLGEDHFRQEIMAEYVKPVGVVYREWNEERQFIDIPYDRVLPLHVSFDFGINDPTAVIWIQPNDATGEIRIIDYYEASNADLGHFVSVINSKNYKQPDLYTGDIAGRARSLITGTSPISELYNKGITVRTMGGVRIEDQVRIAHTTMRGLYVDKTRASRFRDILLNYRYPPQNKEIRNQSNEIPIHDEWSHGARAYEYWCVNTQALRAPSRLPIPPAYGSGDYFLNELYSRNEDDGSDY